MSAIYSLSGKNGESSRPQLKIGTSSPNRKVKVESLDHSLFISASPDPTYYTITDRQAPAIKTEDVNGKGHAKALEIPGPLSTAALIETARLVNGLVLKNAADLVPHVHYPFGKPKSEASSPASRSKTCRRSRKNSNKHHRSSLSLPRVHPLAHLKIYTKTFHCTSIAPRQPGDHRRLIELYSKHVLNPKAPRFYRKIFLAGPPEKTEVGDNRIFYRREFL
jgi:hypothetical protein